MVVKGAVFLADCRSCWISQPDMIYYSADSAYAGLESDVTLGLSANNSVKFQFSIINCLFSINKTPGVQS